MNETQKTADQIEDQREYDSLRDWALSDQFWLCPADVRAAVAFRLSDLRARGVKNA